MKKLIITFVASLFLVTMSCFAISISTSSLSSAKTTAGTTLHNKIGGVDIDVHIGSKHGGHHRRHHHRHPWPKKQCVKTPFGAEACGYDCKISRINDKVKCAKYPNDNCMMNNFGDIKCGSGCRIDNFQNITCDKER